MIQNCIKTNWINIFSKHFPKLNHFVETWFSTFLTSFLLRFMNSLSYFISFRSLAKFIYLKKKYFWLPFQARKCTKWQGQPLSKIVWYLKPWVICIYFEFILSKEYVAQFSHFNENASLTSLHTSHTMLCCWTTVNIWHVK